MNFRICSILLCVLSATQLAGAQEQRVAELKPSTTATAVIESDSVSMENNSCTPVTQPMAISSPPASAGELLIGTGVDPNDPQAVLPLFVPQETKIEWAEVGDGKRVTLNLNGIEVTLYITDWRVADDISELSFRASVLHYSTKEFRGLCARGCSSAADCDGGGFSLLQIAENYLAVLEIDKKLKQYVDLPLYCKVYGSASHELALSFEVDRVVAYENDPPPTRQQVRFDENGRVIQLLMAQVCACCNPRGSNCPTDNHCQAGLACGDDAANAWSCLYQTTGGEKEVFLAAPFIGLAILGFGGLFKRR